MPISATYELLKQVALVEYSDIVLKAVLLRYTTGDVHKLRFELLDASIIDVFLSASGRYSYHWDRRPAGKIRFFATIMHLMLLGKWLIPFPTISMMGRKAMLVPVISATIQLRPYVNSVPLPVKNYLRKLFCRVRISDRVNLVVAWATL